MTDLEELLAAASGAGWDWFAKLEKRMGDRSELSRQDKDERRRLAEAAARIFRGSDGELVLGHLKKATLDRVIFVTQLGVDPKQALLYGAFREGQNALFVALAQLIAEGRGTRPEDTRKD